MTELWRLTASELVPMIRSGAVSSREVTTACLDRVDAVNGKLNALVEVHRDQALAAADAADAAVRAGRPLGVLHGVPVTIKVNVDQAGCATTNGLVAQKDNIATEDSPVVANLRRAGAVIIGRTNTPAFSMRWFTDNDLHGRTLNPWSAGHTPGGSSGGASAAVAAGMGPIGHGNDLAGSVRFPAYCTGVTGLRPSLGRVPAFLPSMTTERPLAMQLMSVQGPLARSVADLRIALSAMAAGDPRDPWWVPAPLQGPPLARPLRVAMTVNCRGTPAHPTVVAAVRQAATWLQQAGYVVDEVEPPSLDEAARLWGTIANAETRLLMGDAIERLGDEGIRRSFRLAFDNGGPVVEAVDHMRAQARRTTLIRDWQLFFERYPLVLCPVSGEPPFPWGLDTDTAESAARAVRAQESQFALPLLGLPGVSVPTGIVDGLPMGVQLTGPRFREDLLLDAAAVIEAHAGTFTPIDPLF